MKGRTTAPRDAPAILDLLRGGDRRSIGRSDEVAALVSQQPQLFATLIDGMLGHGSHGADPLVRMRCADAAEKVTARHPELLRPFRAALFRAATSTQPEVRWHVAQMLPRLQLTPRGRARAAGVLRTYLADASRIVQACAVESLAHLAADDPPLRAEVLPLLHRLSRSAAAPAVLARARRVIPWLETLPSPSVTIRNRPA
jgi:hypothetical protein